MDSGALPTVGTLAELARLVEGDPHRGSLYVRWSHGPAEDLADPRRSRQTSRDALTGVVLPGLSANPLRVEPWWGDRSARLWVARRLYDYRHLRDQRGPGVRPWVLIGRQIGRGPDNEPLVVCRRPVAWISDEALAECERAIEEQASDEWGPLDRRG
jgi:Family of unknown function (DUF6098)